MTYVPSVSLYGSILMPALLSIGLLGLQAAVPGERQTWLESAETRCGPGLSVVGSSGTIFGCVDRASGHLVRVGGTLEAETTGKNRSLNVDVHGLSSVDGCTEVVGSVRVSSSVHWHSQASMGRLPMILSTRNLRCGTDTTWHPDGTARTVTVTDAYFFTSAPFGEGRQLPSLGWNAT